VAGKIMTVIGQLLWLRRNLKWQVLAAVEWKGFKPNELENISFMFSVKCKYFV
jgi:hypothetical protein